jgi:hypothetical protein
MVLITSWAMDISENFLFNRQIRNFARNFYVTKIL